ncbi:hypothetical protein ABZT08_13890 [Streptomyces sp. NPDC005526]|uniref:hypothetical protein n=1 Tax=Streptomyces sp. NPDC005526 TaxID=3156885 RepID=UPI0033BAFFCA
MRKTLITAVCLAAAGTLALTGQASAATNTGDFTITFPDKRPATAYYVANEAKLASGNITAESHVSWQILDDQVVDLSKRFTSFKINTRLESRPGKDNPDAVEATKTCDLTKLVNDHYTWFLDEPASTCTVPSTLYDGDLWWSSDSTVVYDIEGDGKGPITKQLLGSPLSHG